MKAFASALLLAGAHAAAGAIDFSIEGKTSMVSLSSPAAFLAVYGSKAAGIHVLNDS